MLVFVSPCALSNLKRIAALFFTESWFAFASAHNADFLKEFGADEVIDYNTKKFEDVVSDIDVVFNATPKFSNHFVVPTDSFFLKGYKVFMLKVTSGMFT